MKIMVSSKPISIIHHGAKDYRPNRKGLFEVEDGHVADLRAHGLRLDGEPDDVPKALAAKDDQIAAMAAQLKAQANQIAELQKAVKK